MRVVVEAGLRPISSLAWTARVASLSASLGLEPSQPVACLWRHWQLELGPSLFLGGVLFALPLPTLTFAIAPKRRHGM
jgi:hypothetical protein